MADLVITASAITPGSVTGYQVLTATAVAGETITAGQAVYINTADSNKIYKCDANTAGITASVIAGVSRHAALAGQPITYQTGGPLNFGAILTAGIWYVVSGTAGGIAPTADLASAMYSALIGYAYSTSVMMIMPVSTGVVLA